MKMTRVDGAARSPLKILYVMDALQWGETAAGTEGQLVQLLTHLDRDRFEPSLAVFRPTPYTESAEAFPCSLTVLNIPKLRHPRSMLQLVRLGAHVRSGRFRIVHVFLNDASIAAPFFCRLGGARVIVSRRDMGFWYTRANLCALRLSNLFVSRMIANSDAVRRNVHHRERYPLSGIDVLANGHDPRRFDAEPAEKFRERLNIGPEDPIVGMVANFNPWKRHVDLIRAFRRISAAHPSAHLVLVGGGDAEPLRAEVRQQGLDRSVHIVEGITNAIPVVKHFTVGVLCSDSEGASNAVIEYMGSGKPTVCTNVGGNPELIADNVTGFLVTPRDVDMLASRINHLLADAGAAASMGQLARLTASRYTSRRMADAHMELYEHLARTSRATEGLRQIDDRPSLS
jgi:glycosyltransferase involved in cell wall biosynthesis